MADRADEAAPSGAEDNAGEPLPTIELETLLSRSPSRRKRLAQLALLLAAFAVILVTFWGDLAPTQPAASVPTPQPTRAPDTLLITSDVNYGTVTVNGRAQQGALPLLAPMRGDSYTIRLDAPPFLPKTCQVNLPSAESGSFFDDNCQAYPNKQGFVTGRGVYVEPTFMVNIVLTFADLPADQQRQVNTLLAQRLTSEQDVTVPAGSYFATGLDSSGKITSQRATAPLRASAILAPAVPSDQQPGPGCFALICPTGFSLDAPSLTGHLWAVAVSVALRWRFSQASGAVVSDLAYPAAGSASFYLAYDAAAGWSISAEDTTDPALSQQLTPTFCATGTAMLWRLASPDASVGMGTSHDQGATGCEMLLLVNNADQGFYLWRFGVLLTADARARAAHPELPIAPPAELAAIGA